MKISYTLKVSLKIVNKVILIFKSKKIKRKLKKIRNKKLHRSKLYLLKLSPMPLSRIYFVVKLFNNMVQYIEFGMYWILIYEDSVHKIFDEKNEFNVANRLYQI